MLTNLTRTLLKFPLKKVLPLGAPLSRSYFCQGKKNYLKPSQNLTSEQIKTN